MENESNFLDKFAEVSAKIGNQVHLRSLRDGFATIMPIFILAGIAALLNNVVFTALWSTNPDSMGFFPNEGLLAGAQYWGNALSQGALAISAILLCGMVAYSLATNKRFDNPISCVVVSLASFFIVMPQSVVANLVASSPLLSDSVTTAEVSGAFITSYTGTNGMFTAIIIGLLAPTIFIAISGVEQLRIKMPDGVPPAVEKSFNVLIPMLLTLGCFGLVAAILFMGFGTDITSLINIWIQAPLRTLTTNPVGLVIIYSLGTLLFCLGIHQSTINGVLVEPILTIVLVEAMELYNTGGIEAVSARPDLFLNMNVINVYALMGGSGCTLALLLATFIWGKWQPSKEIAKLGILPGIFNINEPVIYGYPIVFNLPLMIPFVLNTALGITISYFATVAGLVSPTCIQVPWTTPIIASGLLSTGGDIRAAILQVLLIALFTVIYLPFMKASEKAQRKQFEMDAE